MNNKNIAIITLIFPAVLAIGIFTIPFVSDYSNHLIAETAASQSSRWFWGHIVSAVAFGVSMIAAYVITQYIYSRGQKQAGMTSLCLVSLGGTLMAAGLGADGVGPVATIAGGSQASVFFEGSGMMITGIFMAGIVLLGFGVINQIIGLKHTGLIPRWLSITLIICAVGLMGVSAIPSTLGLYILALLACVIYGSLSILFRRCSDKA